MSVTIKSGLSAYPLGLGVHACFVMSDGAFVAVFYDGTNLAYSISTNGGTSWGTSTTISALSGLTGGVQVHFDLCRNGDTLYGAVMTKPSTTWQMLPFKLAYSSGSITVTTGTAQNVSAFAPATANPAAGGSEVSVSWDADHTLFHVGVHAGTSGIQLYAMTTALAVSYSKTGTTVVTSGNNAPIVYCSGTLYAMGDNGSNGQVYSVSASASAYGTWSGATTVTGSGTVTHGAVGFLDTTQNPAQPAFCHSGGDLYFTAYNGSSWSTTKVITGSGNSYGAAIAANDDSLWVATSINGTGNKYAVRKGAGGTWGSATLIDSSGDRTSLPLGVLMSGTMPVVYINTTPNAVLSTTYSLPTANSLAAPSRGHFDVRMPLALAGRDHFLTATALKAQARDHFLTAAKLTTGSRDHFLSRAGLALQGRDHFLTAQALVSSARGHYLTRAGLAVGSRDHFLVGLRIAAQARAQFRISLGLHTQGRAWWHLSVHIASTSAGHFNVRAPLATRSRAHFLGRAGLAAALRDRFQTRTTLSQSPRAHFPVRVPLAVPQHAKLVVRPVLVSASRVHFMGRAGMAAEGRGHFQLRTLLGSTTHARLWVRPQLVAACHAHFPIRTTLSASGRSHFSLKTILAAIGHAHFSPLYQLASRGRAHFSTRMPLAFPSRAVFRVRAVLSVPGRVRFPLRAPLASPARARFLSRAALAAQSRTHLLVRSGLTSGLRARAAIRAPLGHAARAHFPLRVVRAAQAWGHFKVLSAPSIPLVVSQKPGGVVPQLTATFAEVG